MSARVVALVKLLDETLSAIDRTPSRYLHPSEVKFWWELNAHLPVLRQIADQARLEQGEAAVALLRQDTTEIPAGG